MAKTKIIEGRIKYIDYKNKPHPLKGKIREKINREEVKEGFFDVDKEMAYYRVPDHNNPKVLFYDFQLGTLR